MKTKEQIQYNRKDDKIEVARTFDNQPSLDRAEDLRKAKVGLSGENSEPKYANFLCFVVSVQTNKLISRRGGIGYSKL